MSSLTNPIKNLARRFASLPPAARVTITKKLLDLETNEQASAQLKNSFLEQFWDEVESAHGDHLHTINPFREVRKRSKALAIKAVEAVGEQGGGLLKSMHPLNLMA
jgi:hypothetical protein